VSNEYVVFVVRPNLALLTAAKRILYLLLKKLVELPTSHSLLKTTLMDQRFLESSVLSDFRFLILNYFEAISAA